MTTEEQEPQPERERSGMGALVETVVTVLIAVAAAWLIQAYVVKPYKIPSGSMENTLRCRDRVLVDRVSYHLHKPKRGDVIVFHPPAVSSSDRSTVYDSGVESSTGNATWKLSDGVHKTASNQTYIKRLIGLPGDTVQVKDRHAYINGKELSESYVHPLPPGTSGDDVTSGNFGPVTLPKGAYLMLGDNRTNSRDGRWFGPITRGEMIGKAFMVYWPPSHFGGIPKHAKGPATSSDDDPSCEEGQPSST